MSGIPTRHLGEFEGERNRIERQRATDNAGPGAVSFFVILLCLTALAMLLTGLHLPELPA